MNNQQASQAFFASKYNFWPIDWGQSWRFWRKEKFDSIQSNLSSLVILSY